MSSDLVKLERARAIPDSSVKEIDPRTYEIESSDNRNQGEVIYSVIYLEGRKSWWCSCKDFMFRNTEETPDYVCKHIIKITEYRLKRLVK